MQGYDLSQGFRIDDILVEPQDGTLTHPDGSSAHLEPKVMEVLVCLVGQRDRTVSRTELLDAVWSGQIAADELLTRAVSEIRRALGDDPRYPRYVRTVPKRGYRLISSVELLTGSLPSAPSRLTRPFVVSAAALALAAILVIIYLTTDLPGTLSRGDVPSTNAVARSSGGGRPVPLTSAEGYEWSPSLSPDGRFAAFVSSPLGNFKVGDIHVVEVGSAMPFPLTNDPEASNRAPTWSPDGTRIAFARSIGHGRNEIVVKAVLQGSETQVATVDVFWGQDWSPEVDRLAVAISEAYDTQSRIYLLSLSDGSLVAFTDPAEFTGDYQPRFSPDGGTLAFLRQNLDGSGADLCLKPMDGGEVNCITPPDKNWPIHDFAWSPNGNSLIVSVDGLLRVPVSGAPIEPLPFGDNAYNVATSRHSNRLVFERFVQDSNLWRVPGPAADFRGAPERLVASTRAELLPRYSPDGEKIAFVSGRSGGWEVWVADADGANPRRLTEWGFASFPYWSPDSRLISFSSGRYAVGRGEQSSEEVGFDADEAFLVEASGGVPRMISDGEGGSKAPSWSRDGQFVFFTRGRNACGSEELWRRQVDSGEESRLTSCAWRPLPGDDGRVYFYNREMRGISSVSMSGDDERLELAAGDECHLMPNAWTVWESNLVYVGCEDRAIKMLDLETQQTSELAPPLEKAHLFEFMSLDVSPDGQWILYSRIDRTASDLILIEAFQ